MGNLFDLAELQLIKEGKEISEAGILAYAVKIRKWLDRHKGKGEAILAGADFYQYGTRIKLK
jgi:hypothetical protein